MNTHAYTQVMKSWAQCKIGMTPSGPVRVLANLTGACQSLCKTCDWGRDYLSGKYKTNGELKTQEWIDTLSSVKDSLVWVSYSGGEPTMRPDLPDIARAVKLNCSKLIGMDVSTNAISPKAEEIMITKLLDIEGLKINAAVSLDGPRELHDFIRGQNGNFDSAIQTYKMLQDLAKNHPQLSIHFNHTLSNMSVGTMWQFLIAIRNEGITPSLDNISLCFAITGPAFNNLEARGRSAIYDLNYDTTLAREDLSDYLGLEKGSPYSFNGLRKIIKRIDINMAKERYLRKQIPVARCAALRMNCFIHPTGELYPCTVCTQPLGNIRSWDFNLKEAWKSRQFNLARKQLKREKCICKCWSGCETFQTILVNLPSALRYS